MRSPSLAVHAVFFWSLSFGTILLAARPALAQTPAKPPGQEKAGTSTSPPELLAETSLHLRGLVTGHPIALPLDLREKTGRKVALRARLVEWAARGGKDETWAVTPSLALAVRSSGEEVAAIGAAKADDARAHASRAVAFELPAGGGPSAPELSVEGLCEAGTYEGKVVIESEGATLRVPVRIALRQPWWVAAACVFAGVLGSFLVGAFARKLRAQLVTLARLEALDPRLEGSAIAASGPVRDLYDAIRARSRDLRKELEPWSSRVRSALSSAWAPQNQSPPQNQNPATPAEPVQASEKGPSSVDVLEVQVAGLDALVAAWRDLDGVPSEELAGALRTALTAAAKELRGATTKQAAEEAAKKIRDAGVESKAREACATRIRELRDLVAAARRAAAARPPETAPTPAEPPSPPAAGAPAASADDTAAKLRRSADEALQEAELALVDLEPHSRPLTELRTTYERARTGFARALSLELRARLREAPLPGIPETGWTALRTRVDDDVRRIDPFSESAVSSFRQAEQRAIARIAAQLRPRLGEATRRARSAGRTEVAKPLEDRLDALEAAAAAGTARYDDAERLARELDVVAQELEKKQSDRLPVNDTVRTAAPPTPYSGRVPDAMVEVLTSLPARAPSAPERLARHDGVVFAVTLAIAVLTGLKLMWVDDAAWGGVSAYLSAFLWGLGVQVASGSPFEGLVALLKRLTG